MQPKDPSDCYNLLGRGGGEKYYMLVLTRVDWITAGEISPMSKNSSH